jgi:hypothetical protein
VRISQAFTLNKTQAELDFVDVDLATDNPLFLDPFALSQQFNELSRSCHLTLIGFFQKIVDDIRAGQLEQAQRLLFNLSEPNETRLGLSKGRPQGAGIGGHQARQIFEALRDSAAVREGFLTSLEECELMIDGIGRDKISDLTTNVIRQHLADYTLEQCELLGIAHRPLPLPPVFNSQDMQWETKYHELPFHGNLPILLVPKLFVRYEPAYESKTYYQHYVLEFLQAEELRSAGSSLVRSLKSGKRVVFKKDVAERYPFSKRFLFEFSREHPEVLTRYREDLARQEQTDRRSDIDPVEEDSVIAEALIVALRQIPGGGDSASTYHKLMTGIVEFLFYPHLIYPKKEHEIHDGRKRIDIVMDNSAVTGVFNRLPNVRGYPCAHVMFECKNYRTDVKNPELDQLAGRFSPNRGKVGFLCCREFEDRALFIRRCVDTFKDDRGLILPLDDNTVVGMLELVRGNRRNALDATISALVDEVWLQ